jgi:hypothetical protein
LDREGLAAVWSVKKMSDFLTGRHFTLITDNRPNAAILSPDKATPPMTGARLQRWSSFLSSYNYEVECRAQKNANADFCSRLPLSDTSDKLTVPTIDAFYNEQFETLPVTTDTIHRHTRTDRQLSQVYEFTLSGWPRQVTSDLQSYCNRRLEISTSQGCLLWGNRVIIPSKLRKQLLAEIHNGHLGMVRMKSVARSFVWWPGMDSQIENTARQCSNCQQIQRMPTAVVHTWERPSDPWQRIHADFLGPIDGQMFLIVVDAYSKWPEVVTMSDTTSARTIAALRSLFAVWGLPKHLHTDNAQQFCSSEFEQFLKANGIQHTTSAVYHPSSNGQAEHFVQDFKRTLKAMKSDPGPLDKKIACFLLTYRTTVNSTTGEIPSVLMTGRRLRTRLDLIKPTSKPSNITSGRKERMFEVGQAVWTRDYRSSQPNWVPGEIESKIGTVMFNVKVNTANHGTTTWKRHVDQLMARNNSVVDDPCPIPTATRSDNVPVQRQTEPTPADDSLLDSTADTSVTPESVVATQGSSTSTVAEGVTLTSTTSNIPPKTANTTACGRTVKMPAKFNDSVLCR